ncbi:MAG: VOC family protein [Blastocatellia bacterium]
MAEKVKPVPEGFHTATPYLIAKGAADAIEFYKQAFGAIELERLVDESGSVRHAAIKIGDSPFMITDESPDYPEWLSQVSLGGSPVHIYLYVPDADAVFDQAIAAGAKQLLPMRDQFYGDRSGGVTDPFGHVWYIAIRIKNISPEDLAKHMAAQH